MKFVYNIFRFLAVRGSMKGLLPFIISILLFSTCINPPDFSDVPYIGFVSVNKKVINQEQDSIQLVFSFTDGDGDLGVGQDDTSFNTYVKDVRTGKKDFTYPYRLPLISSKGMVKDISGEITITLPGVSCFKGNPTDTVIYKIQIKDKAGHMSNIIESPQIIVNCQ